VRIVDHDARCDAATDCDDLDINVATLCRHSLENKGSKRALLQTGAMQMEEKMMTKMLIPVVAVSLLVVTASACYARGGASAFAPGTSFHAMGSVAGHPGASGYAPGHLFRAHGSLRGHPGASGFAPGHRFAHRMR
jgi:hypothetical protein